MRSRDTFLLHFQVPLRQLEAAAGNLLGQLGALCAEQLRKATILQGMQAPRLPSHEHMAALAFPLMLCKVTELVTEVLVLRGSAGWQCTTLRNCSAELGKYVLDMYM